MLDWTALNGFDWLIVVVVAASILLSLIRGFTREALSLAGWVAAFVLANLYALPLATLLAPWIASITGRYVAAFALLFVGTLLFTTVLVRLLTRVVRVTGLSLLDRLLGTVFGFTRGVILVLVVVYLLRQLVPPQNLHWLYESQLMPHIDMLVQWVQLTFDRLDADPGSGLRS